MTEDEKLEFREFLFQAHEIGQKTSSALIGDVYEMLKKKDEKMDSLTLKIDNHITHSREWEEKYSPYLEGIASVTTGGKIVGMFIVGVGAVGAAILAIYNWFK